MNDHHKSDGGVPTDPIDSEQGEYVDKETTDGREAPVRDEEPGEYTDVDRDGDGRPGS